MNRIAQLCFVGALGLHGFFLFGINVSLKDHPKEPERPQVEVNLIEALPPIEEPPPAPPEPEPEPPAEQPKKIEQPAEPSPPEPPKEETPPPPPLQPETVKALPVSEPVVAPADAEFQVAATTKPVVELPPDVPLSPPVKEVLPAPVVVKAEPRYHSNPEPDYPLQAKRRRQEGLVLLTVLLDTSGLPTKVEVKESSGYTLLDNAALEAVRAWKFEPAMVGKDFVPSEVEVPVRFRLAR